MIAKSAFLKYLLKYAGQLGIIIRSEKGNFRSGYCSANGSNLIILNRKATEKTMCDIILLALKYFNCPLPDDSNSLSFYQNEQQNYSTS